jgi:hypothetical protein
VERLRFNGAYDFSSRTNFKLSNFMKRKMLQTIRLHALKMGMLSVEVNPAYTSKVAIIKYGKRYGGFNRHQLASFVIARRALGYGEAPVLDCLPRTKQERKMWNSCISYYYGYLPQIQTLLHHEPMEWKSGGDDNGGGGGKITELLTAPPAITSSQMGLSHSPSYADERELMQAKYQLGERAGSIQTATQAGEMGQEGIELALRARSSCVRQRLSSRDKEDSVIC